MSEAVSEIVWFAPCHLFLLAGIGDVTTKDRVTHEVSLRDNDVNITVDRFVFGMQSVLQRMKALVTEGQCKVTFCHIIGMDLLMCNRLPYKHPAQDTLDEIIQRLNQEITAINKYGGVVTPWTASMIHCNKKGGRKVTKYHKLAEDGLHLTDEIRMKWAEVILATVQRTDYTVG